MLNSVEHEILNAYKYKTSQVIRLFLGSDKPRMLFFPLIHVKMPTIVDILTFMSRKNFMLSCVEHEKCFITSGPGHQTCQFQVFKELVDADGPCSKGHDDPENELSCIILKCENINKYW